MLSALHKGPQHLSFLGTAVHVLPASTYDSLLQGGPEVLGYVLPREWSSTNNWEESAGKSPSSLTPWPRQLRPMVYPGFLSFPARGNSNCLPWNCAHLACSPSFSLSHSLTSIYWNPNNLRGLLLMESTNTAQNGPSPVFLWLRSSRIHCSLAPPFCLTLLKFQRESLALFLVGDKLIFSSQATFRGGHYAQRGPPQASYPP